MHQVFEMLEVNNCIFKSSESMLKNMPHLPKQLHSLKKILLTLLGSKIGGIIR